MGLRKALVIALVFAVIHDSNPIAIASPVSSDPTRQKPISFSPSSGSGGPNLSDGRLRGRNGRPLKGRFLHVTDIHPDEFYIPGSSIKTGCHYLPPKPKKPTGRDIGDRPCREDCDTPLRLFNITMEWLESEWADEVDFVICSHDIDNGHPRTPAEIYESNRMVADRMDDIFLSRGVPVVPSLGDFIFYRMTPLTHAPHASLSPPHRIWSRFIPFESYQVFQRGAYFSLDIIPNELGALSLNTLYWYDNNKAVEGCKKGEPGSLELDWLEVQLDVFRQRGMQVWLSGHVPPTPRSYFPDCYRRYGELAIRFQDTIVGQLFGHANVDYFFWIDTEGIRPPPKSASIEAQSTLSSLLSTFLARVRGSTQSGSGTNEKIVDDVKKKPALHDELKEDFGLLPSMKKVDMDNFVIVNVSPSVIPTYYPSVRVFTYNNTGGPDAASAALRARRRGGDDGKSKRGKRKVDCRLKKNKDKKSCRIKGPRYNDPMSPSRTNTLWTPLGYVQFSMPGLDDATADMAPQYTLEYVTYDLGVLDNATDYPVPHRLLPKELFDPDNTTEVNESLSRKYAPYGLPDLTIGSWMRLAKRLGNGKHKKMWKRFKAFMYMNE
ncbi:hypothetical protein BS47DRAFT_1370951 [Hydnum rufescens UP504]|uniref:Endopolyphosphatase n=1 Tax=Hydnum rufescens UP504 TaxID=1448309 RepID=A0A9P6B6U3_9AGAM|nr:hypothetical protein BS47DRAFT_1370951 [Hydnum rufescens UP504]